MDRNSQSGQVMIELLVLAMAFALIFIAALSIAENGDRAQKNFRFDRRNSFEGASR